MKFKEDKSLNCSNRVKLKNIERGDVFWYIVNTEFWVKGQCKEDNLLLIYVTRLKDGYSRFLNEETDVVFVNTELHHESTN